MMIHSIFRYYERVLTSWNLCNPLEDHGFLLLRDSTFKFDSSIEILVNRENIPLLHVLL